MLEECGSYFSSLEVSKEFHFSKILSSGISTFCGNLVFLLPWLNIGSLLLFQI